MTYSVSFSFDSEQFSLVFQSFSKAVLLLKQLQQTIGITKIQTNQQLKEYSQQIAAYHVQQPTFVDADMYQADNRLGMNYRHFTSVNYQLKDTVLELTKDISEDQLLLFQCYIMAMRKQQFENTIRKFTQDQKSSIFEVAYKASELVIAEDPKKQLQYVDAIILDHKYKKQLENNIKNLMISKNFTNEPAQKPAFINDIATSQSQEVLKVNNPEEIPIVETNIQTVSNTEIHNWSHITPLPDVQSSAQNLIAASEKNTQVQNIMTKLSPEQMTLLIFSSLRPKLSHQCLRGMRFTYSGTIFSELLSTYEQKVVQYKEKRRKNIQYKASNEICLQLLQQHQSFIMCQQEHYMPRQRFTAIENVNLITTCLNNINQKIMRNQRDFIDTLDLRFQDELFNRFQGVIKRYQSFIFYSEQIQRTITAYSTETLANLLTYYQDETIIILKFITYYVGQNDALYIVIKHEFEKNLQSLKKQTPRITSKQFLIFSDYLITNFTVNMPQYKILGTIKLTIQNSMDVQYFIENYKLIQFQVTHLSRFNISLMGLGWLDDHKLQQLIFE
ncbi:hypothetical protein SS50377_22377 [Spironucleus salmonicida]|uniref:Uncharacterized protein n=1 Tax=Spironucleus salmonicida TaxID=348837 RepID=V6LCZ9_9EUKA|nr:hypothetical protein SS50377_22377 [Spironucleus salmonicida]|eukprot:EST42128.1 Hypothetical protein SS50377_18436 [Spironucleus salmonicida]